MSILNGLNVVEISGTGAAAMGGKHLADWGARVTMIEPAGGTPLRDVPPYYEKDGARRSATWAWLSLGKLQERIGSGFTTSDALDLCEQADVVIIERELAKAVLGIEPAEVEGALKDKTTCIMIAPFSLDGPYADYTATDLGLNAMGGWMQVLGDATREPLRPGGGIVPRITGLYAVVAALIGLRHVRQGGAPQYVDISSQAAVASMVVAPWLVKSMVGFEHGRRGNSWPMGVMKCKDGYIGCPPLTPMHWELLCQLMGIGDVLELPEGRDIVWRMQHGEELRERATPWLMERTRDEIVREAQAFRLPAAHVHTIADRLACEQLEARGFWLEAEIDGQTVKVPRPTFSIAGAPPANRLAGPPERSEKPPDPAPAPEDDAPFAGLRVLDLTSLWSGPYATMMLGAMGADIIKVESIQRPDPYRYTWAPPGKDAWYEWAPLWNDSNCNKRDITIDMTSDRGKELIEQLVAKSDVVISNFSNRVMPNLGLTNDRLLAINPNVIAITMPGYGPGGPWENYTGYAVAFEQLVYGSMTGYADDDNGYPSYAGGFCDPMVGLHTVSAILLALQHRERTGKGTEIEIPQCETLDSLFAPEQIAVQVGAPVPSRRGNKHEWMAPHEAYRVSGTDEWITLAIGSDAEFQALAEGIGHPELATDARFATVAARKDNEQELDAAISEVVADLDGVELEHELQQRGVAACHVVKSYDLVDDPGLNHISFFQQLDRKITGTQSFKRWPFRFSSIDASHKQQPPLLGEHNAEVLGGLLGLSDDEIARLEETQVIGTQPLGAVTG